MKKIIFVFLFLPLLGLTEETPPKNSPNPSLSNNLKKIDPSALEFIKPEYRNPEGINIFIQASSKLISLPLTDPIAQQLMMTTMQIQPKITQLYPHLDPKIILGFTMICALAQDDKNIYDANPSLKKIKNMLNKDYIKNVFLKGKSDTSKINGMILGLTS